MANQPGQWNNPGDQPSEHSEPTIVDGPVLVVEADAALRRVIAVGLRGRGLKVVEARALGDIWEHITTPPAAIVLDVGLGPTSEWMLLRALGGHRALRAAPLLLLAWDCPAVLDSPPVERGDLRREHICLTKPFDARALFAAVERLVAAPALLGAVAAASVGQPAQAALAAGSEAEHRHAPGASIGPLVAAGAATLAVAGFLIQPALSMVGVVLLIAAVLWWSTTSAESATPA